MDEDRAAAKQRLRAERRRARQEAKQRTSRREAICRDCKHAVEVAGLKVFCGRCLCPLVSKTRDPGATCPIGKW